MSLGMYSFREQWVQQFKLKFELKFRLRFRWQCLH